MIRLPRFELEEVEDFYTYFVHVIGISEELFWYSEWSTLLTIVANKNAVDKWRSYTEQKLMERK